MNWPAYKDYRDTGVDWLGSTPSCWSVERMSWLFNEISSGTTPESGNRDFYDGDINWVTTGELRERGITQTDKRVTPAALTTYSALKVYPAGTLLIAMYGATIGRLGWLDAPACTNQACCAFANPKRVSTRFAYYALSAARDHLILLASGGGQPNINQDKLRSLRIAVPSRTEQAAIVRFLDSETGKIDALIAKQEQLVATLREDRTATITHAVTRGLDPAVDLVQPQKSELPSCPKHWTEQISLKRVAEVQTGLTLGKVVDPAGAVTVPYLRVANVQTSGVDLDEVKTVEVHQSELNKYLLRSGDVLMTEGGDIDKLGRGCVWSGQISPCIHQNHVFAVRCDEKLSSAFLVYLLDTAVARNYFFMTAKKTTNLASTNSTTLGAFAFSLPPRAEQDEIVDQLNDRCAGLDSLITKANAVIAVLREYRSALITDAVTGKIDVREAA